jgi:hypothetical protein
MADANAFFHDAILSRSLHASLLESKHHGDRSMLKQLALAQRAFVAIGAKG